MSGRGGVLGQPSSLDWSSLAHANGPVGDIPGLLEGLVAPQESVRASAAEQLWASLCHQGTVYAASVAAVPFLAAVAIQRSAPLTSRLHAGLLIAACAGALPGAAPPPDPADPALEVADLAQACRRALEPWAGELLLALADASAPMAAGLLAALAPVAHQLPPAALRQFEAMTHGDDRLLAAAAGLCTALARGDVPSDEQLAAAAALDEDIADYLPDLVEESAHARAVTVAVALCQRSVASHLP